MNFPSNIFQKDPDKSFIVNYAPIFTNLNFFEKNLIIQRSKVVAYHKDEIIYKQFDSPDAFYCVISGRVRIFTRRGERKETLEYLNCGKYFGIISLLTGDAHSVNAEAANDSKILKISKEDFQVILHKIPKLAIDLSKTLSRRLRKKDVEKKIFECNIVSVFGAVGGIGRTMYAINLNQSLKRETGKNIILIDVSSSGNEVARALGIEEKYTAIKLDTSLSLDDSIKNAIHQDLTGGISILSVRHNIIDNAYATKLNALLTYLSGNYHYIIVDLPAIMDVVILEILSQSDIIHILTDYDVGNLEKTKSLISDLFQKVKYPHEKIKVILNAKKEEKGLTYKEVLKLLSYNIHATLPVFEGADILPPPQSEYSRAVRRIARELGDVRVGLALSGGSALGLAHIGVIKVLERENIPIDIIASSSIGALVGSLWAAGLSSSELEELALEYDNNRKKVFRLLMDPCFPKLSFFKGRRIRAFLEKQIGNKTFQDVKFPFKVVACNLSKRQELVFDSGPLVDAVMASIAIPGIFAPLKINGDLVVDGGIMEAVPIGTLVKMGIKKVIAVNVLPSPENIASIYELNRQQQDKKKNLAEARGFLSKLIYHLGVWCNKILRPNILDIIVNSIQTMEYVIAESDCQKADVVIKPTITGVDWFEFFKAKTLIKKGEEEASNSLSAIKNLINE